VLELVKKIIAAAGKNPNRERKSGDARLRIPPSAELRSIGPSRNSDLGLEPQILNEAKNELKAQYLDWNKAKSVLGWKPQHNLDEGLKETIAWYKNYLKGKQA